MHQYIPSRALTIRAEIVALDVRILSIRSDMNAGEHVSADVEDVLFVVFVADGAGDDGGGLVVGERSNGVVGVGDEEPAHGTAGAVLEGVLVVLVVGGEVCEGSDVSFLLLGMGRGCRDGAYDVSQVRKRMG